MKPKILPPVYFFALLTGSIAVTLIFPKLQTLSHSMQYFGAALLLLGASFIFSSTYLFRKNQTPIKPLEKSTHLVTVGLFQISRNPIYLGFVLMLWGEAYILRNPLCFLSPLILFAILDKLFIPKEEKLLAETFGNQYLAYKNSVCRWI